MIRTETTLIVGAGANREIEMADGPELLNSVASGFDFERLNSELKSRDMINLAALFEQVAPQLEMTPDALMQGGMAIRQAAKVSPSIDAILEQFGHDPAVLAAGKLAIIYYTLQAEAKATLNVEPHAAGELPLRGTENWLFQLGQLIVNGVPRAKAEECLDKLSVVCFNYDRAIEHYLPFVLQMAFGMPLDEARQLVGSRLQIIHPYGCAGRLPWQENSSAEVDWSNEAPSDYVKLTKSIFTASQRAASRQFQSYLLAEMARGKRLVFLGFGFDPMNVAMLFDDSMLQDPDILIAMTGVEETERKAIIRLLKRQSGITNDDLICFESSAAFETLQNYGRFLQS